jgi:riboflavin synthase
MFTGIIEEVGQIVALENSGDFRTLRVKAGPILDGLKTGDSIAVNGVCLTVRTSASGSFTADLSRETLERTSLNALRAGTTVNLERPMRADGRFGGHIVQGHVDGVGRIRNFNRDGDNWNLQVEFPESAARYIVHKGSIAIDGISLTVADLSGSKVGVQIVPFTFAETALRETRPGDAVNLEADVIGKYVARMMDATGAGRPFRLR